MINPTSLKIVNKTEYRQSDLRKFFLAGIKHLGSDPSSKIIEVVYSKREGASGLATLPHEMSFRPEGRWIRMRLPRPPLANPTIQIKWIAQVFEHELAHNLGVAHSDMDREVRNCTQEVPWADGFQIRMKVKPKKKEPIIREKKKAEQPCLSLIERRELKVRNHLKRWEKKLRISKTYVQKYRTKVRYYEKKKSAGGRK